MNNMKQLKRTILTLVALLALTTGARAQWTGGTYTATANENPNAINVNDDATLTINADVTVTVTGGITISEGKTLTVVGPGTLVVNGTNGNNGSGGHGYAAVSGTIVVQDGANVTATGGKGIADNPGRNGGAAFSGAVTIYGGTINANGGSGGTSAGVQGGGNGGFAFAGTLTYYDGSVTATGGNGGKGVYKNGKDENAFASAVTFVNTPTSLTNGTDAIDQSAVTNYKTVNIEGADVDVNPASTTVTFTRGTGDKANEWTMDDGMPAGNVRVSVEYYDYAELTAADAIAANNAARAQTDDLLATVAENPATGGTLMYYLTTDATFTQAQALALAETDWSSTVPTAEDIDGAGATVYLWYYIKGDDEHSDTDPVQLTVNVQPEPTYNVTFAEGTNPDPENPEWTATPNTGVKKGDNVTVTYTGTRKALGVRAEKKAELTK